MSDHRARSPWPARAAGAAALAASAVGLGWIVTDASAAPGRDRDCAEFTSSAAAQTYFESRGYSATNDPERLDGDGDGYACDSTAPRPDGPPTARPEPEPVSAEDAAAIRSGQLNAK